MDRVKLEVRSRTERGKDVRALRAAGEIPAVIYARGAESTAVTVDARALRTAVTGPGGLYALLDVTVDGTKPRPAIIKDMQLDPVRDRVVHVDFHEIPLDRKIQTVVAVHLEGIPHGVEMGGVLRSRPRSPDLSAADSHPRVDLGGRVGARDRHLVAAGRRARP